MERGVRGGRNEGGAGSPHGRGDRAPWLLGSVLWLGIALSPGSTALALETRLSVDPTQNLAELTRTGQVIVSIGRVDGVYTLDASAVLHVDPDVLLRASTDYERYPQMGVPNLRESHVVASAPGGDLLYTWSWMSLLGQSSKHYLAVQVRRGLGPARAAGIQWALARPRAGWPHEEGSAFTRLEGSWYLEPLADGTVYVRYFLTAVLDPAIPDGMVSWLIKRQLTDGARSLVQALGREAARRS